MGCDTCKWMTEPEDGPHCDNCAVRYTSEYEPMSNRDRLRLLNNAEFAVTIINRPWCDPIMGDMTCGTVGRCAECVQTWLNDIYRGEEWSDDAPI